MKKYEVRTYMNNELQEMKSFTFRDNAEQYYKGMSFVAPNQAVVELLGKNGNILKTTRKSTQRAIRGIKWAIE